MIDGKKGLIAWFARNPVAANLLMIFIVVAGFWGVFEVRKESFPRIESDTISVRIPYLGAAPQEVEQGVILSVEEALEGLDGIEKITATASEGMAAFYIDVDDDFDISEVLDEVRMKVDAIPNLPENTEKPNIYQQRFSAEVMLVQVYGDLPEIALKELAKEVRSDLIAMPQISKVDIWGDRDYEISIEVSESRLREYGLTFEQVSRAVQSSSVDLPGGSIKTVNGDILLRTKGQAYQGYEFENIVLVTREDGTRLRLKDVAEVKDGFDDRRRFALFNGQSSVGMEIKGVGEQDAIEIAGLVKEYVDNKKQALPAGANLDYWGDSTEYLQGRMDLMIRNMWQGGLLVFLVLSLFLRLRLAFWVMLGLPVCFLGTFMMMPLVDVSVNMLSLFAFILVLGIVVDDAIIIGESAYSEVEKKGPGINNIVIGAKHVATPATFGVLTTIAAFMPMFMVGGVFGTLMESIAWVVILCLIFSLVESKWILPAHLAHMKVPPKGVRENAFQRGRNRFSQGFNDFVERRYRPALEKTLHYRYVTLASFIGVLIIVIGMIASGRVKTVFFPSLPGDFIISRVTMIEGTPAQQTIKAMERLESALLEMDKDYQKEFGESVIKHRFMTLNGDAAGQMWVEAVKGEDREVDGFEIARRWRDKVGAIAGAKRVDINGSIQNGGGSDLAFKLSGKNMEQLQAASGELKRKLSTYEGVFDINDTFSGGKEEIILKLKPQAEAQGLRLTDLARQVRYAFYGVEAQRIQRGDEEVKVMVRYPRAERESIAHLENMYIRTPNGEQIPFSSVAEIHLGTGYSSITRVDGVRGITVSAAVDKAIAEPGKIVKDINENVIPDLKVKYPGLSSGLEGNSKEEQESQFKLLLGFLLAQLVIYALLAIPLKSYSQPLLIMSVIPFGIIGAVVGHLILGLSVSMLSMFGIIALSGVVVNDSLIMVDFVNRARQQGVPLKVAAVDSGVKRFRAIVLTSLTTFFGLVPILAEKSLQAQIVIPMAVSLAFGILFATVITLFLIPSLYLVLEDIKGAYRNSWRFYFPLKTHEAIETDKS